jgi:hypothetical protein
MLPFPIQRSLQTLRIPGHDAVRQEGQGAGSGDELLKLADRASRVTAACISDAEARVPTPRAQEPGTVVFENRGARRRVSISWGRYAASRASWPVPNLGYHR